MPTALRPVTNQLLQPLGGIPLAPEVASSSSSSPLVMAGGATAGVGGALAVGLGVASLIADGIASDPKNRVEDKEGAIGWGRLTLVSAAASAAVAAVGVGIFVVGVME